MPRSRSDIAILKDWNKVQPVHPFADPSDVEQFHSQLSSNDDDKESKQNRNNRRTSISSSSASLNRQNQTAALLLTLTDAFSDLSVVPANTNGDESVSSSSPASSSTSNNNKLPQQQQPLDEDDEFFLKHQQQQQKKNNANQTSSPLQQQQPENSFGAFTQSESYSQLLLSPTGTQQGSRIFRKAPSSMLTTAANHSVNNNNTINRKTSSSLTASSRPGSIIHNNRSFNNSNANNNQNTSGAALTSDPSLTGEGSSSFVRVPTIAMTTQPSSTTSGGAVAGGRTSPVPLNTMISSSMADHHQKKETSPSPTDDQQQDAPISALHTRALSLAQKLLLCDDDQEEDDDEQDDDDIKMNEEDDEVATLKKLLQKRKNQFYNLHDSFPFAALIAALAKEEDDIMKEAKASSRTLDADDQVSAGGGLVGLLRSAVSQKKYRFQQDGFDLDLTYITPRIIAMGFPSSGAEAFYRNPMDQVEIFFKRRHPAHYRVYNLCSERQYDQDKLEGRWRRFPFDDHNAPCPIKLVPSFVSDATKFLREDPKNVVAIHCKAGKGRTGLMIACLLMALVPSLREPDRALGYFASQRTDDAQGVTIASQIRYVQYWGQMLAKHHGEEPLPHRTLSLQKIVIWSPIKLAFAPLTQVDNIFLVVEENGEKRLDSLETAIVKTFRTDDGFRGGVHYVFERSGKVPLLANIAGDIRVTVNIKTMLGKDELFHYWFNTTLCNPQYETMSKFELDKACKDHKNQVYCTDLMVQTYFIDGQIRKPTKYKPVIAPPQKNKKKAEEAVAAAAAAASGNNQQQSSGQTNISTGGNSPPQQQQQSNTSGGGDTSSPMKASSTDPKKDEKGFFSRLFGK